MHLLLGRPCKCSANYVEQIRPALRSISTVKALHLSVVLGGSVFIFNDSLTDIGVWVGLYFPLSDRHQLWKLLFSNLQDFCQKGTFLILIFSLLPLLVFAIGAKLNTNWIIWNLTIDRRSALSLNLDPFIVYTYHYFTKRILTLNSSSSTYFSAVQYFHYHWYFC